MEIPHYKIGLDVNEPSYCGQRIIVRKGDTKTRYLDVTLYAAGEPIALSKERVTLTVADENGTFALTDCTITDGVVVAELTQNILAKSGTINCELTVYGTDTQVITSVQFTVEVIDTLSTDVVERESDFSALQSALSDVATTSNRITELSERVQPIALGGTGATAVYNAAQNLKIPYLGTITSIESGADLNDYTTDGTYDVLQSVSADIVNTPITNATYKMFVLHAVSSTLTQQVVIVPKKGAIFMRYLSSGTWSEWTKITSYTPTVDEVGTWTPTLSDGTITVENAVYVYDGNTVYVKSHIKFGADVTVNSVAITGLPLSATNGGAALTVFPTSTNTLFAKAAGNTLTIKSATPLAGEYIIVSGVYKI